MNSTRQYAFLMESKTIAYYVERRCKLEQTGAELDDKNYGIGMRKGTSSKWKKEPQIDQLIALILFDRVQICSTIKWRNIESARKWQTFRTREKMVERTWRWWYMFGKRSIWPITLLFIFYFKLKLKLKGRMKKPLLLLLHW